MKQFKIFYNKKGAYILYLKDSENHILFYESVNKTKFEAIEECLAYLSSYTDYVVFLDDSIKDYDKVKK